jgi:hypothetical protein
MAQKVRMRFAYQYTVENEKDGPERVVDTQRGFFWSGPYEVVAKNIPEAKNILTDVILRVIQVRDNPLFAIRLLEVETLMKPARDEVHFDFIDRMIIADIEKRELRRQYPDGIPRYRTLDADWTY